MNYNSGNDLSIIVGNKPVREYHHQGKVFIEGRRGHEYQIRFKNNSTTRKKIVVSVDGLNVMTGDSTWDRAYVVDPWREIIIPGWRKDSNRVANFEFSSVGGSHNQHNDSGDVNNVGVIGCKIFREKINYQPPVKRYFAAPPTKWDTWKYPTTDWGHSTLNIANDGHETKTMYMNQMNALSGGSSSIGDRTRSVSKGLTDTVAFAACSASAPIEAQSLGTGWGDESTFKTQTVYYDFYDHPDTTMSIYYDNRKGLEMRGINIHNYTYQPSDPNPFPDGCPAPKY